jgi:hypothetical protein
MGHQSSWRMGVPPTWQNFTEARNPRCGSQWVGQRLTLKKNTNFAITCFLFWVQLLIYNFFLLIIQQNCSNYDKRTVVFNQKTLGAKAKVWFCCFSGKDL